MQDKNLRASPTQTRNEQLVIIYPPIDALQADLDVRVLTMKLPDQFHHPFSIRPRKSGPKIYRGFSGNRKVRGGPNPKNSRHRRHYQCPSHRAAETQLHPRKLGEMMKNGTDHQRATMVQGPPNALALGGWRFNSPTDKARLRSSDQGSALAKP